MMELTLRHAWVRSLKREVTILTLVFMGLQVVTNLVSVGVIAVLSGPSGSAAADATQDMPLIMQRLELMESLFIYFFMFALPIGMYFLITYRQPVGQYFKFKRPKLWYTLGGVFGVAAINYAASILSEAGDMLFHRAGLLDSGAGAAVYAITEDPVSNILVLVALVIFPAFMEEVTFRGIIAGRLGMYNKGMAVIVSALLFGLVHMTVEQIPFAICAGLLLGYVYLKTGSIWSVVIIHGSNNLISYLSMCWTAYTGDEMFAERSFMIFFACLFVIGFVAVTIMFIKHRRTSRDPLPLGRALTAAIVHPVFLIVAVLCVLVAFAVSAVGLI